MEDKFDPAADDSGISREVEDDNEPVKGELTERT